MISKASAEWQGDFKSGKGTMTPAHGPGIAFGAGSRFEGAPGSNPEELIGAALSGCFSMALTVALGKAGKPSQGIKSQAQVHLDKVGDGFAITSIDLQTEALVPGMDDATFQKIAQETKAGCPVGKALGAVTINLSARLAT